MRLMTGQKWLRHWHGNLYLVYRPREAGLTSQELFAHTSLACHYTLPLIDYSIKWTRNSIDVTIHICYCNHSSTYSFQVRQKTPKIIHGGQNTTSYFIQLKALLQRDSGTACTQTLNNFCQLNGKIKFSSWTAGGSSQTAKHERKRLQSF